MMSFGGELKRGRETKKRKMRRTKVKRETVKEEGEKTKDKGKLKLKAYYGRRQKMLSSRVGGDMRTPAVISRRWRVVHYIEKR